MRCGTAKKRLSDELDGALAPGRKIRLEAHLRSCPDCRDFGSRLVRLQAGVTPAERPPEYWTGFERRLQSKLSEEGPGRSAVGTPFMARRWRAWAAVCGMALAAAAIWSVIPRPGTGSRAAWVPYDDSLIPLLQEAESDPGLERAVEQEILASIEEMAPAPGADMAVFPADDPLFWEGLSEEELHSIASELEKSTGRGGPQ